MCDTIRLGLTDLGLLLPKAEPEKLAAYCRAKSAWNLAHLIRNSVATRQQLMPSIFSHVAVPISIHLAGGLSPRTTQTMPKMLVVGMLLSILPDADVALHYLGVPYQSAFGHRGFTHSIAFAFAISLLSAWIFFKFIHTPLWMTWLYLFICAISHPLLDMCTTAGLGAALLWPFSEQRFFAPFRPIEVSPLSIRRFFGEAGLRVIWSEILWIWLPLIALALILRFSKKK